ncbi:glycerol-3-phosphate 1-O-acyltransferase [Cryptosporangium aurantiacum]|uniref:Glycerol-3-phosphate acyltransferase n=1 Tax=Cryptosporangium aurantiacum TaxID=134849 RepID=A0A1M7MUP6_9ACTN|nr:glycerol-3-phosphate 1-O-acyltransferase [Cryptosporangium aurantiacum]SHM94829.1 glycerol-3-phosphate acyltransferase [Cryptosporangium aurantiacum]
MRDAEPDSVRSGTLYLVQSDTPQERQIIAAWLTEQLENESGDGGRLVVDLTDGRLHETIDNAGDLLVTPLRVAWLPAAEDEKPLTKLRTTVARMGARRSQSTVQRLLVRQGADRYRVLVGKPATVDDLRERWQRLASKDGFDSFVRRQAVLALDRAERALIGSQYKVARYVVEEITASPRFRAGVEKLADELDLPVAEVSQRALGALHQMVAAQDRRAIDAWNRLGRYFSRAYRVVVDDSKADDLRELGRKYPLVFLPSHRSYLDPLVLRPALLAHGLPLNHVMGGINIDFWPVGPLTRRSGYVFIRRSIADDAVYRWVLREYMGYLLSKRFNLEWYIEGGRSRTGKLRPPRYGLLTYLAEAFRSSGAEDVYLVPVSLSYDQLYEVGVMAEEAHGAAKSPESFAWLLKFNRAQNNQRGCVQVRFGEPLSLRQALADAPDTRLAVQKTAFEVCHRINEASPVMPRSLVTLALLGIEDRALTVSEVAAVLDPLTGYFEARQLATRTGLGLADERGVRHTLDELASSGVVERYDKGTEPVYRIGPDQHLVAAFYRNNTIHFLVTRAVAELMLQAIADGQPAPADLIDYGWKAALALRDLLKFEFFFSDKDAFRSELHRELALIDPEWRARLADPDGAATLLASVRPHLAHRVLQPYLEAYWVVAQRLAARDPRQPVEAKAFTRECLDVAKQLRMQQQLASTESISGELFATALKLAANHDLVDPGRDEVQQARQEFAAEITGWVERVRRVRALALGETGHSDAPAEDALPGYALPGDALPGDALPGDALPDGGPADDGLPTAEPADAGSSDPDGPEAAAPQPGSSDADGPGAAAPQPGSSDPAGPGAAPQPPGGSGTAGTGGNESVASPAVTVSARRPGVSRA